MWQFGLLHASYSSQAELSIKVGLSDRRKEQTAGLICLDLVLKTAGQDK